MIARDQRPNYVTVLSVIKAVGMLSVEKMCGMIHGYLVKIGFEDELSVVTALIGVYSSRDIRYSWRLFHETVNRDVVLWSAMVSACVKSGDYVKAFELFRDMQLCNIKPNHGSVMSLFPACAGIASLRYGKEIHGFCIRRMFYSLTNIQNSLVDMYAKCWDIRASSFVFRGIVNKDLVSWRSMILGCIQTDCLEEALHIFSEMRFFYQPDEGIFCELIGVCSQVENTSIGKGLHCHVLKLGYLVFPSIVTTLLQMYTKFNVVECARMLFDDLCQKDLIAWSAMISAYAQSDHPDFAFNIFRQMKLTGVMPNAVSFVSLLHPCSSATTHHIGESIHAAVIKSGYTSNTFLVSALIDMYCKIGHVKQGNAVFEENPTLDFICWSSMINGFGINGFGEEAIRCFSNMLSLEIKPNGIVFLSVLSACSHCGLEYEGWNWFYAMEEKYRISPSLAHYACMVDMLSRQGNVAAALDFVRSMPIDPDERIWGALLAGCRLAHESFDNTEFVAKQLIRLDPQNTSYYVMLSNLYAEEGKWKEVEKLRHMLNRKGLKKYMGYSISV
ncbi:hypothetical protein LIER_02949 [Lithospermum erythrorhizon]|uniref:Pentatricopeptide repeat-containing protein n=1 Tax=Lithospermum erythrorhizon TaxID=34254 RepID=A0AAV3NSV7_LITER